MQGNTPAEISFAEGAPLYLQVARHLQHQISRGIYPVGTLLPTEAELSARLGVSRHTIRQAIAQLRQRNVLSARKGVGTRVEAPVDDWRTRFTANSRGDLFDFARETELHFTFRNTVEVRGQLATDIGARPGRRFVHAGGPRFFAGQHRPLCYNEVYLDLRLKPLIDSIDVLRVALFTLVEQETGERVRQIQQEVRAIHMPDHIAPVLDRAPGDLCMKMTRRYLGAGGRLLEYAVQYYQGDTFAYQTTLSST